MFEEKENRYRLVCLTRDKYNVLKNVENYEFLKLVDIYDKDYWSNIIIDSEKKLDYDFVNKFNDDVDQCLGTFEDYDTYFD